MFCRGVAFLEGACSVLEGRDIFGGRLKCFGGAWHFGGCLQCFGGAWHFGEAACSVLEGACSVLEGRGILEKLLAVFWRGVVRVQSFICDFL